MPELIFLSKALKSSYFRAIGLVGYMVVFSIAFTACSRKATTPEPISSAVATPPDWPTLRQQPETISKGRTVYVSRCAVCHGPQGQGLVGPNLTDKFWLHGGKPEQILSVIENGVPEKGMVAWKTLLNPTERVAATVFILSLQGSNPPNPKAAQGTPDPEVAN